MRDYDPIRSLQYVLDRAKEREEIHNVLRAVRDIDESDMRTLNRIVREWKGLLRVAIELKLIQEPYGNTSAELIPLLRAHLGLPEDRDLSRERALEWELKRQKELKEGLVESDKRLERLG